MFHECFCQLFFLFQATLSACGYFQWQQSNTLQTKCSIKVFHKAAEHNILLLTFKLYIPPKMCHWNVENSQGVFWDEGVSVPGSWTNVASRPSWRQMTFFLILIWSTLVHQISSLSICASFVKRRTRCWGTQIMSRCWRHCCCYCWRRDACFDTVDSTFDPNKRLCVRRVCVCSIWKIFIPHQSFEKCLVICLKKRPRL